MKDVFDFDFYDFHSFKYQSKVCSIACSISKHNPDPKFDLRVRELTQSYFNQWHLVIRTYKKLYQNLYELNSATSDKKLPGAFTSFDIASIFAEPIFSDDAYLLLISMKTFIDLFACITDIAEHEVIRDEHKLPDFHTYATPKFAPSPPMMAKFTEFKDKTRYPWIELLRSERNKIVHRGYLVKPIFGFNKNPELTIGIYKGASKVAGDTEMPVGKLFEDFHRDMKVLEQDVTSILLAQTTKISRVDVDAHFKTEGQFNIYSYDAI